MESRKAPIRISVPAIELNKLSFCDGSLGGFETWVKKLPMANVGASAKLLFQATRELNITQIPSSNRYKMLEIVRTPIYQICASLSKRFLNQSVVLSDSDLKIVALAQTLQNQLAIGYKHVVLDELSASNKRDPQKMLVFAIHRAISDMSQTLLRALQLYSPAPKGVWLEMHQLFALAKSKNLHQLEVKDNRAKFVASSKIQDTYLRALLLGSCKPNQLRQNELTQLHQASELWTGLVSLASANDAQAMFITAQHKDSAPIYRNLIKQVPQHNCHGLNTSTLVLALQKHQNKESGAVSVPGNFSDSVLSHLIQAWGAMAERSFRRSQNSGEVSVAVGLLASHYFCAEEHSFPYLLKQWNTDLAEKNPKAEKVEGDIWDQSFDAGNHLTADSENIAFDSIAFINQNAGDEVDNGPRGTQLSAQIVNTSPGGYGIALENPPSGVQTGELLVIKEPHMKNWSLGCIRWIRTQRNEPAQLGVELIAPQAQPVAARILNKTGDNGELLRGLLIPALPAAGQEETLILPVLPFKVGCKAELVDHTHQQRIQLLKRHNASRSFVQYGYQSLSQVLSDNTAPASAHGSGMDDEDEFASIWDKL